MHSAVCSKSSCARRTLAGQIERFTIQSKCSAYRCREIIYFHSKASDELLFWIVYPSESLTYNLSEFIFLSVCRVIVCVFRAAHKIFAYYCCSSLEVFCILFRCLAVYITYICIDSKIVAGAS